MDPKKNLKYVKEEGRTLELEDLSKGESGVRRILRLLDKLLFKRPVATFTFLILLVALPISLYLTLRSESTFFVSEAETSYVTLSTPKVTDLSAEEKVSYKFLARGRATQSVELLEITSPDWFSPGNQLGEGSSKYIIYEGQAGHDLTDRFALLAKGVKKSYSQCNGCDSDGKHVYALSEFNLNTNSCEGTSVWGRNPVDGADYCQEFANECLLPLTWKKYSSEEECINSNNPPQIKQSIEDEVVRFSVDCDGNVTSDSSYQIDKTIQATDSDGDIVRFSANSEADFVKVTQDSVETIVKDVSGQKGKSYSQHEYSATISGSVSEDLLDKTTSIDLNACDVVNNCSIESFNISVIKRSSCEFVLPATGEISIDITSPGEGSEFKGINNIVWSMSGTDVYYVEVNLMRDQCRTFVQNIAKFEKLVLNGSKGYAVSFDSRQFDDGDYCVMVLAREEAVGSNWDVSDQVEFKIRNDNQSPYITSNPSKTNLVTGERFEYKVEATDPDGDSINYDVVGLSSWLTFENQIISGSTAVPGTYNIVVFVDDGHGGYDTQQISINVRPPTNQPTSIKFLFPVKNSVLAGTTNTIKWEVSDSEGISQIQLYYSEDGETWVLIGNYPEGTTETNWDVSNLENGDYILRLVVTDNSEQKVQSSLTSEIFYIANPTEEISPEPEVEGEDTSMPAINNLTPKPDSEIYSKQPLISASLHPSDNAEILEDEVNVYLDDEKISLNCDISTSEVMCEFDSDLETGRHKVKVEVKDSKDKSATEIWYFTIVEKEEVVSEEEEEVEDDYITIPFINKEVRKSLLIVSGVLCCAALLLILIPWLVYFIWSKRSEKEYGKTVVQTEKPELQDLGEGAFYTRQGYPGEEARPETQAESQPYEAPQVQQQHQGQEATDASSPAPLPTDKLATERDGGMEDSK